METIDTMQNGDIQQLRHPIAPIAISDSRATDDGGRGRLALNTDESQLYTNEHGQLCLMTPVQVNPAEVGEEGMPLTVDFERGMIRHGTKIFSNKTVPNLTGIAPVQIKNNEIGLNLSDSFVLEGSMDGTENATSSLELKYPIAITGDLPSDPRAPLTFNFQDGTISRDGVNLPNQSIIRSISVITTPVSSVKIDDLVLSGKILNNLLYLNGYITFSTAAQIVRNTSIIEFEFPSENPNLFPLFFIANNASNYPFAMAPGANHDIYLQPRRELSSGLTFSINFSHIIGHF